MQELYDRLYDIDTEHLSQPEDFYTALSDATETTRDSNYAALDTLYLFEFCKIVKIIGNNNPYACIEWPGIHIPQAILSLLEEKGLLITFYNDKGRRRNIYCIFTSGTQPAEDWISTTTPTTRPTS